MIVDIEVLPRPSGTPDEPYRHVEAAIASIADAGVHYEVGALGTTFEAPADEAWAVTRAAHDACLAAGAESVVTIVKLAQSAGDDGPTIAGLTGKFR